MLELAERLGARRSPPATTRASCEEGAAARRRDERKDQSYVLSALSPGVARAAALPARRAAQARGARARRARPAWRSRAGRDSQDLCFLAGTAPRSVPRAPRRPRPAPRADRRPRRARCSASTAARTLHGRPAPRPWHRRAASRCTCSPPTPTPNTVTVGPRAALLDRRAAAARADPASRRRLRGRRARALARPRVPPAACRGAGRAGRARATASCGSSGRWSAPRRASSRACTPASVVVGYATIAAQAADAQAAPKILMA